MAISSGAKAINPRQKYAKLKGETTVEVENHQGESVDKDRVEQASEESAPETRGTLTIAGVRPIGSSDLQVAEQLSISGVRPVSTSNLEVVETYNAMGIRPIGANTFKVVESINLSGVRPVSSSSLVVAESYSVFGNRPVASNDIDDSANLMGFLD
ncbi:MAG: hypothetical protein RMY28_000040 [Nostoc sp. ChiSLP01]|nr:hypothetical protein [Nostoc sp. CmiSLP01]MDZ8289507.1 hypothetical protein [Nostoc sp. ChiSLP01]